MVKQIILASQSPRRKTLLEWAEIDFEVRVQDTDESFPEGLSAEEVPVFIARNKARAVTALNAVVVAADTVVVLGQEIFGKPQSRADALRILTALSGKVHKVITGVCILSDGEETASSDVTEVEFHELTEEQILFYIDTYKPFDKAGAYAIQEWIGVVGIKKIDGDFYNVMGLPISRVVKILQRYR